MTHTKHPEAIVGDITFGPFAEPRMKAILQAFGPEAFTRSSACMEFDRFLQRIKAGGDTCLEIGTYHGITAVMLSKYFKRVVCVSIDVRIRKLLKREIVSLLGIENIEFIDVMNNVEKAQVINSLEFDFCYSDGDHIEDTDTDFALVERCGRVLFHEYWPLQVPVWNLVNSLPADEVTKADVDCFAYWQRKGA